MHAETGQANEAAGGIEMKEIAGYGGSWVDTGLPVSDHCA
jgi:hypothetical protein